MRVWQRQDELGGRHEVMRAIVSGGGTPPPYVGPLRMPRAEGYDTGQVWLRWKMEPVRFCRIITTATTGSDPRSGQIQPRPKPTTTP